MTCRDFIAKGIFQRIIHTSKCNTAFWESRFRLFKTDLHPWLPSLLEPGGPLRWVAPLCGAAELTEAPGECPEVSLSTLDRPAQLAAG